MAHDPSRKRRALRKARERGCSVYIPAEVLEHAGMADGEAPLYRTWASRTRRGAVMIQLYREA